MNDQLSHSSRKVGKEGKTYITFKKSKMLFTVAVFGFESKSSQLLHVVIFTVCNHIKITFNNRRDKDKIIIMRKCAHTHTKKNVWETIFAIINWYVPSDSYDAPRGQTAGARESLL